MATISSDDIRRAAEREYNRQQRDDGAGYPPGHVDVRVRDSEGQSHSFKINTITGDIYAGNAPMQGQGPNRVPTGQNLGNIGRTLSPFANVGQQATRAPAAPRSAASHQWDTSAVSEIQRYAVFAKAGGFAPLQNMPVSPVDGEGGRLTGNSMIAMTRHTIPQLNAMTEAQYANLLDQKMQNDRTFRSAVIRGLEANPNDPQARAFLQQQGVSSIEQYKQQLGMATSGPATQAQPTQPVRPTPTQPAQPTAPAQVDPTKTARLQSLLAGNDKEFPKDQITGQPNAATTYNTNPNLSVDDNIKNQERKARKTINAIRLDELFNDADTQGGVFVNILQAILKALGFDVDITGEMDAKTTAAVPEATAILSSRDGIINTVTAADNPDIQAIMASQGGKVALLLRVEGHRMMFDQDAIKAADGSLKALLEASPDALAALEAAKGVDTKNALLGIAGMSTTTAPGANTTPSGTTGTTGTTTTPPNTTPEEGSSGADTTVENDVVLSLNLNKLRDGVLEILKSDETGATEPVALITPDQLLNPEAHAENITSFFDTAAQESAVLTGVMNAISNAGALTSDQITAIKNAYTGSNADVITALDAAIANPPTPTTTPAETPAAVTDPASTGNTRRDARTNAGQGPDVQDSVQAGFFGLSNEDIEDIVDVDTIALGALLGGATLLRRRNMGQRAQAGQSVVNAATTTVTIEEQTRAARLAAVQEAGAEGARLKANEIAQAGIRVNPNTDAGKLEIARARAANAVADAVAKGERDPARLKTAATDAVQDLLDEAKTVRRMQWIRGAGATNAQTRLDDMTKAVEQVADDVTSATQTAETAKTNSLKSADYAAVRQSHMDSARVRTAHEAAYQVMEDNRSNANLRRVLRRDTRLTRRDANARINAANTTAEGVANGDSAADVRNAAKASVEGQAEEARTRRFTTRSRAEAARTAEVNNVRTAADTSATEILDAGDKGTETVKTSTPATITEEVTITPADGRAEADRLKADADSRRRILGGRRAAQRGAKAADRAATALENGSNADDALKAVRGGRFARSASIALPSVLGALFAGSAFAADAYAAPIQIEFARELLADGVIDQAGFDAFVQLTHEVLAIRTGTVAAGTFDPTLISAELGAELLIAEKFENWTRTHGQKLDDQQYQTFSKSLFDGKRAPFSAVFLSIRDDLPSDVPEPLQSIIDASADLEIAIKGTLIEPRSSKQAARHGSRFRISETEISSAERAYLGAIADVLKDETLAAEFFAIIPENTRNEAFAFLQEDQKTAIISAGLGGQAGFEMVETGITKLLETGVPEEAPQEVKDLAKFFEAALEAEQKYQTSFYEEDLVRLTEAEERVYTYYTSLEDTGALEIIFAYFEQKSEEQAPVLIAKAPEEITTAFSAQASNPDTLPTVMAFDAQMVTDHGINPVSPIAADGDTASAVETYRSAWETDPTGMTQQVKNAILKLGESMEPTSFAEYLEAINKIYAGDHGRPEGEKAAVMSGIKALAEQLNVEYEESSPQLSGAATTTDYKAGLNS